MFIVFNIQAPFAAWGVGYQLEKNRTHLTNDAPTKSAIAGFLGAAMGIDLEDPTQLNPFVRPDWKLVTLSQYTSTQRDFQTKNTWLSQKFKGTPESRTGPLVLTQSDKTDLSYRDYLVGFKSVIAVEVASAELAEKVRAALVDPVYPLCAGRAACPLSADTDPVVLSNSESVKAEMLSRLKGMQRTYKNTPVWACDRGSALLALLPQSGTVKYVADVPGPYMRNRANCGRPRTMSVQERAVVMIPQN